MDTRFRLALAASLSLLPLLPLTYRLIQFQIVEHHSLESRASGSFSRSAQEIVPRADIVDREGRVLARSVPVWNCFADKKMIARFDPVAAKLSPLLKMPAAEIARKFKQGGRFPVLKRGLTYEESAALAQARIEGIGTTPAQERVYPNAMLARSILGQVSSDGKGVAGLELSLNRRLTGKARRFQVIRDGKGRTIHRSVEEDEPAPEPIALTIDRNIQFIAEEALDAAAKQFSIKQGIVGVQDPHTGELLAMAVYPSNPLKNPIVQDTYEPGSTFKIVAAAAALEEKIVREDETFFCENGRWQISPGVFINDHEPEGDLTLAGILEQSSNIGIAKIAERIGAARFYRHARSFGFGSKSGILMPGETSGEFRPLSDMTRVGLASASYGYGIAVSALQLLGAYSALANGGTLFEPTLLLNDRQPITVRRVASEKTVARLARILEDVVDRGTATTARIPGYRVAGKTGTSRKLDPTTKKYSMSSYNASFGGFLPASAPRWTILVVIEDPKGQYYGAQVAAPVFARIGKQLLALKGVPPDQASTLAATSVTAASGRGAGD